MKVTFVTVGTRGDVQPFIALSMKLKERGHQPTICTNVNLKGLVEKCGIQFAPIKINTHELYESEEGRAFLRTGNFKELVNLGNEWLGRNQQELHLGVDSGSEGADLLISGFLVDEMTISIAEKKKIPFMLSNFAPYIPCSSIPSIVVTTRDFPFSFMNKLTQIAMEFVYWGGKKRDVNGLRRQLGLQELRESVLARSIKNNIPYLGAWSPQLFSKPSNWGPEKTITGTWNISPEARQKLGETEPPAMLVDWISAGSAPFFFSFGSMPLLDPEMVLKTCADLARKTQTRIIFGSGWSNLSEFKDKLPENMYLIQEAVNHDWLFSKCAGVLHHGGSGSTATSAAAGRPTWVFSLFADQPFWGSRVEKLGFGGHTKYSTINPAAIERAFETLRQPAIVAKAKLIGEKIQQENGAENAANFIEEWLPKTPVPVP